MIPTSLENKKLVGMRKWRNAYSEAEIVELRSNVSIDRVYLIDDYPSKKYFERLSSAQKSFLKITKLMLKVHLGQNMQLIAPT